MSRFPAVFAVPLIVVALVVTSCARSVTLGHEEAVEVMVLDGVNRGQADCVVSALDGQLRLEKITGLDVNLSDDELTLLGDTSARCAPLMAAGTGVLNNGQLLDEFAIAEQDGLVGGDLSLDDVVLQLIADGLEADIGDCLLVELELVPDAEVVLTDLAALSRLISGCRLEVGAA